MDNNKYYNKPELLDNFLKYLTPSDIKEGQKTSTYNPFTFGGKLASKINRYTQKAFVDGIWYGKKEAKQLILDYINDPECQEALKPEHEKIVELYQRLKNSSSKSGTWADDIPEEALQSVGADQKEDLEDELLLADVEELILEDVFLPDPPEEKIFIEDVPRVLKKSGSSDSPHTFQRTSHMPPPTTKVLFHIQADEFGANSTLEGGFARDMVEYVHTYLTESGHPIGNESLLDELNQFIDISKDSVPAIKNKIQDAIKNQRPILLSGGWTGQPAGHAMYYEIIPEKNRTITFRIFNTGAGSKEHEGKIIGHKMKYKAYDEWKGINPSSVTSEPFLLALKELETRTEVVGSELKTEYHKHDIYQGLRAALNPRNEMSGPGFESDDSLFMTQQYSGICSWRSLMAFLRTKVPLEEYKQFKCDIKLQSLLDFIEENPNPSTSEWRLVKKSHQSLCRAIVKLYQNNHVGDPYIQKAANDLKQIKLWVRDHKEVRITKPEPRKSNVYIPIVESAYVENEIAADPLLSQINEVEGVGANTIPLQTFREIQTTDPELLMASLARMIDLSQDAWMSENDSVLNKGLVEYVTNLRIDEDFWIESTQRNPGALQDCIEMLGTLQELFLKSCYTTEDSHIFFSDKVYLTTKITFLLDTLCRQLPPPWNKMSVKTPPALNNPYLIFTDPKMHDEMTFFSEFLWGNLIDRFAIDSYEASERLSPSTHQVRNSVLKSDRFNQFSLTFNFGDLKNNENLFWHYLRTTHPEVIKQIRSEIPGFDSMQKHEQDAYIYASPNLPPWLKSIRDSRFIALYIRQNPTSQQESLDRRTSIVPEYKIKIVQNFLERESKQAVVSLKGVENPHEKVQEKNKFASSHRPIQNYSIREMIECDIHGKIRYEKTLSVQDPKEVVKTNKDLTSEEFQEIGRLFLQKDVQLIETLEYFTKHPEKLQDSDYQLLFQILIFETGLIRDSLEVEGFISCCEQFLKKNIENYSESNIIQTTVFLLRMSHQLSRFVPENEFFNRSTHSLMELIGREGLTMEEKLIIYSELTAQLGDKTTLDDQEVALLLIGSNYVKENKGRFQFEADPNTQKEAREALLIQRESIQRALSKGSPNHALLNRIAKNLLPGKRHMHKWTEELTDEGTPIYRTENGHITFDPVHARIITENSLTLLPHQIRQNPLFQKLFPRIDHGEMIGEKKFQFTDVDGNQTIVEWTSKRLIIDQKREGIWFRHFPSSEMIREIEKEDGSVQLESKIVNRWIPEQYQMWQKRDEVLKSGDPDKIERLPCNIYVIDPITKETRFVIRASKSPQPSINQDFLYFDELIESDTSLKMGNPHVQLSKFEDPAYIQEWYSEAGELKKIELPRFNLTFIPDPNNSEALISKEFPGFEMDQESLVQKLGSVGHYILLKNAEGKKKVILPKQKYIKPDELEVLSPNYTLDQNLRRGEEKPQDYYVYDLQKNGMLFSKSREANLYLSETLAVAQEYKLAARYLQKSGKKLSPFTSEEQNILLQMGQIKQLTGDESGNGMALQLYALFLVFNNQQTNQQKISSSLIDDLRSNYSSYLKHSGTVSVLKLEPLEEVKILKQLLSIDFDPIFYLRLKELDPIAAKNCPAASEGKERIPEVRSVKNLQIPFDGISNERDPYSFFNARDLLMITRPKETIEKNFEEIYNLAQSGRREDKEKLRISLSFLKASSSSEDKKLAYLLEAIMQKPDLFPMMMHRNLNRYDFKYNDKLNAWKSEVLAIAEQVLSEMPQKKERVQRQHPLPDHLGLGKKRTSAQPYFPSLRLDSLPPLSKKIVNHFTEIESPVKQIDQELVRVIDSCSGSEPVQQKEVQRLQIDLQEFVKQPPPRIYTASQENLQRLEEELKGVKKDNKEAMVQLEKELLLIANRVPENLSIQAEAKIQQWGKLKKVINVDDLIVLFARENFNSLKEWNPTLSEKEMELIGGLVGEYLLYATEHQQAKRSLRTLNEIQASSSEEKEELISQLANSVHAKRTFDPNDRPAFLAFEYFADLMMRPAQQEKLEQFLSGDDPNIVMEMIMGSGKSKVLLPLLGLMRADGETLSMLIVPQPLFESVSQDTQAILQSISQSLTTIHFDRHTKITEHNLESLLDELQSTVEDRNCLMMTSKSVQCLILKFIEETTNFISTADKESPFPKEIQLMQKILNLLKEKGYPIIDEADTVLNVLKEVSFSGGKRVAPKPSEIDLLSEFYALLYEDPNLKKLARLESDPNPNSEAPVLTEQHYLDHLQTPLIHAILERFKTIQLGSKELSNKIQTFAEQLSDSETEQLIHYLQRTSEHKGTAQAFFDSLDSEIQDVIAFTGEQVSHLLPYTLTRVHDERYGLDSDPSNPIAIPYSASQTPSTGSQFSNHHITMNYTFQTYMKKGISTQTVESQVKTLQEQAMREISASGGQLELNQTEAGKKFQNLRGNIDFPLFNYKPIHLQQLTEFINQNPKAKRSFVSTIALPQLEQFEYKMSCNPHNLVAFFSRAAGFTGTLWNGVSMHHSLSPEPAVGTDAKTLNILWENSKSNAISVSKDDLASVLNDIESIPFSMIADAGGYFKEGSNAEMAKEIALKTRRPVVFYNSKGEQTITDGIKEDPLSESNIDPKDRLTFLDQSHTTGSDVPQKVDALSIVTIGRNMLLRDLLQSVWRLRGLEQSQRVQFLISNEVQTIIQQKLDLDPDKDIQFPEILRFVITNQAMQQGKDNYKAVKEGFQNIFQEILLKVLLHERLTPEAKTQAFNQLKKAWIKPSKFQSRELYGALATNRPSEEVLDHDIKQAIQSILELHDHLPWLEKIGITRSSCIDELTQVVDQAKENLLSQLPSPSREIEDDQTVEVEQELKTETERETELETEEAHQKDRPYNFNINPGKLKYFDTFESALKTLTDSKITKTYGSIKKTKSYELGFSPVVPLHSYLQSNPDLQKFSEAFSGIHISVNVLNWQTIIVDMQLFGPYRTDLHHVIIEEDKVIALTQSESKQYKNHPNYYNLTLGFLNPKRKPSTTEAMTITKIKFLNGESMYSKQELTFLKQWLTNQNPEKMKDLFINHILKGMPGKTARYKGSSLEALFHSLI